MRSVRIRQGMARKGSAPVSSIPGSLTAGGACPHCSSGASARDDSPPIIPFLGFRDSRAWSIQNQSGEQVC